MKRIVVAGGSGFVGQSLVVALVARGDEVAVLTRNPRDVRTGRPVQWNPAQPGSWTSEVSEADAVINLAGENVGAGRWTGERKKRIVESRAVSTRGLVDAMSTRRDRSRVFVSASAVGFYGDRGDSALDESALPGASFLTDVTEQWEEAAHAADAVARVVILRIGVVLAKDGGALGKMTLPFRLFGGGPMGSGRQWMSWIDRDDVIRLVEWAIDRPEASGVYNATAPSPVTNRDFARALGHVLHRPAIMPAPAFALRVALGEMADEMLLTGQRVLPARATEQGFTFKYPTLGASLEHIFGR
jgi:uncharacterized protein (TIGR01777 family)